VFENRVGTNRGAAPRPPRPNAKAIEIARGITQAMGGEAAWKQAHYVRFDFVVTIRGQVNIAQATRPAVVLFNIRDRQGAAYVDGKNLEGPAADAALKALTAQRGGIRPGGSDGRRTHLTEHSTVGTGVPLHGQCESTGQDRRCLPDGSRAQAVAIEVAGAQHA
jgi:hypothetical protein